MKKLLIVSALLVCASVFATEDLKINGTFKLNKQGNPVGWWLNKWKGFKPFGTMEVIKGEDGTNSVKVISAGKLTAYYTSVMIPVKAGDQVELELEVKGKGKGGYGLYCYEGKTWAGSSPKYFNATEEFTTIKNTITVQDIKGKKVSNIRIFFQANAKGEVTFKNVSAKLIKKQ